MYEYSPITIHWPEINDSEWFSVLNSEWTLSPSLFFRFGRPLAADRAMGYS